MKRNTIIIILSLVILAGIFYFLIDKDKNPNLNNENNVENNMEDDMDENDINASNDGEPNQDDVGIAVDKEAPDFTLVNLAGDNISLSDYKGKIVFINFWATWCQWCDIEMPDLHNLDKDNDDLVVLAVNVMEDKKTVEDYINKGGYDFEVVLDPEGEIAMDYLISSFPTTYFIDKEGILLGRWQGMLTDEQMKEILEAVRDMG